MSKDLIKVANKLESLGLVREARVIKLAIDNELKERKFIMLDRILTEDEFSNFKKTYPEIINFLASGELGPNVKGMLEDYIINCIYDKKEITLQDAIDFAVGYTNYSNYSLPSREELDF